MARLVSRSACNASIVPCNPIIFSSLLAISDRETSLPLMTPCVNKFCLLQMALISSSTLAGSNILASCRAVKTSFASEKLQPCAEDISLKRTGVGVSCGVVGMKMLLPFPFVAGVVKTSSSLSADIGVGRKSGLPTFISSNPRFPGVDKMSVLIALRGVSGGGMATVEEASWATFEKSSSSVNGHS